MKAITTTPGGGNFDSSVSRAPVFGEGKYTIDLDIIQFGSNYGNCINAYYQLYNGSWVSLSDYGLPMYQYGGGLVELPSLNGLSGLQFRNNDGLRGIVSISNEVLDAIAKCEDHSEMFNGTPIFRRYSNTPVPDGFLKAVFAAKNNSFISTFNPSTTRAIQPFTDDFIDKLGSLSMDFVYPTWVNCNQMFYNLSTIDNKPFQLFTHSSTNRVWIINANYMFGGNNNSKEYNPEVIDAYCLHPKADPNLNWQGMFSSTGNTITKTIYIACIDSALPLSVEELESRKTVFKNMFAGIANLETIYTSTKFTEFLDANRTLCGIPTTTTIQTP